MDGRHWSFLHLCGTPILDFGWIFHLCTSSPAQNGPQIHLGCNTHPEIKTDMYQSLVGHKFVPNMQKHTILAGIPFLISDYATLIYKTTRRREATVCINKYISKEVVLLESGHNEDMPITEISEAVNQASAAPEPLTNQLTSTRGKLSFPVEQGSVNNSYY